MLLESAVLQRSRDEYYTAALLKSFGDDSQALHSGISYDPKQLWETPTCVRRLICPEVCVSSSIMIKKCNQIQTPPCLDFRQTFEVGSSNKDVI